MRGDDRRGTLGADRGYDTEGFVGAVRLRGVTPHLAQNTSERSSAIDARTTRHASYAESQRKRKRVEEIFGWLKRWVCSARHVIAASSASAGCSRSA
jgi:hypothetical protein